jgi:hypothetical protein
MQAGTPVAAVRHDTGTRAGEAIGVSMYLDPHGTITRGTRGQIEQVPVGPTPQGLHTFRCRVCMLTSRGDIYLEAVCVDMTWEDMTAHLQESGHIARSYDGRLEKYIEHHERNFAAQRTTAALRRAMQLEGVRRCEGKHDPSRIFSD